MQYYPKKTIIANPKTNESEVRAMNSLETAKNPVSANGVEQARICPYSVCEFNEFGNRHSVIVSFEMAYHDWLKLENSKVFRDLVEYLNEVETTDTRHEIQERQG